MVGTPLQGGAINSQGGAKKFRLASLAISHPPGQNSETAPDDSTFYSKKYKCPLMSLFYLEIIDHTSLFLSIKK